MEKICKNCKYWARHNANYYNDKFGRCNNGKKFRYGDAWDICDNKSNACKKNDELYYEDYESYSADFETGENFGCIHWEKKDD